VMFPNIDISVDVALPLKAVFVVLERPTSVGLTGVVSLAVGTEVSLNVIEVIFGCWLLDSSPAKVTFVPLAV